MIMLVFKVTGDHVTIFMVTGDHVTGYDISHILIYALITLPASTILHMH